MSSGQRSFSAPDFLDRLRRDDLAFTPPLTGMVRPPDDEDADAILFAQDCVDWTLIPLGMIDSIELLDTVTCGVRTYAFVAIRLKDPLSEEGRVYARLARYRTERPRKLPERTGDGGPVIGGGGFRGGGRGEFPGGGSFGGGGWSGWSNWGIWCPEHGGFIELYPSAYLAGYYANWHNSNTGHHASTYEIPLPG
jgi:hypothetical protein